jgi:hypothetical protein
VKGGLRETADFLGRETGMGNRFISLSINLALLPGQLLVK